MKEIIVLSGKGGTGKTSLMGAFASLAPNKVLADCDVDAANLHLILQPHIDEKSEFVSGVKAEVQVDQCSGCSTCFDLCQFDAIDMNDIAHIRETSCEGCGVCAWFCPEEAIALKDNHCGYVYQCDTKYGKFVHASLFAGEENSGKLVSHVRKLAHEIAAQEKAEYILVDGAPGIGCPVIASITNATALVVVTEPSQSGLHDLERVLSLAEHFKVPAFVCINKWDLHFQSAEQIEELCVQRNIPILGRIPFDPTVVASQIIGKPLVEYIEGNASAAMREIWQELERRLQNLENQTSRTL